MSRLSKIDRLPLEIRQEIRRLYLEESYNLKQIVSWLERQGIEASRSSVGRWMKKAREVAVRLAETTQIAKAIAQDIGPDMDHSKTLSVLVNLVQDAAFRVLQAGTLEIKEIESLGRLVKNTATALKFNTEQEAKARLEKAARDKAKTDAKALAKVANEQGLSPESIAALNAALGIKD